MQGLEKVTLNNFQLKDMKKKIVLIGGGGHCKVVIDAIKKKKEFDIFGIVDTHLPPRSSVMGISILGCDDILPDIFKKGIRYAFISIGSLGDCSIRKKIYRYLKKIGFQLPVIVHRDTVVAENIILGEGTFVAAGVVINPEVSIGKNAIINTSSSIDHDCTIGDFVHIAPGVRLSGGVKVGNYSHLGTGTNVIQNISIGKCCMVGAGVTVRKNLKDRERYC